MAKTFKSDISLDGNQALDAVLENRTDDPASPNPGRAWFRTDLEVAKYYNGTSIMVLASQQYVDAMEQGLDIKDSVVAAADSNIDLTGSTDPNPVGGVSLSDGDRVLLMNQTTASENGIYTADTASDPSTWSRAPDADEDSEVTAGMFTFVEEGNHADEGWVLTTNDPITVDTDDLSFSQFSGVGESQITKYTETLTSGSSSYTVTHNLGTREASVTIRQSGSPYSEVEADVQFDTTDSISVTFGSATSEDHEVTVIG